MYTCVACTCVHLYIYRKGGPGHPLFLVLSETPSPIPTRDEIISPVPSEGHSHRKPDWAPSLGTPTDSLFVRGHACRAGPRAPPGHEPQGH